MIRYLELAFASMIVFFDIITNSFSVDSMKTNLLNQKNVYYDNFNYTNNVVFRGADGYDLDYSAELNKVGDYYEITFDIINDSNSDVFLDKLSYSEDDKYIQYDLTYQNGKKVSIGDVIPKRQRKTVTYRVSYVQSIDVNEYSFDGSFVLHFEQKI